MITEHHFPTMIYIKDFPDSEKLNKYLEPKLYNGVSRIKVNKKQMQGDGIAQRI